MGTEIVRYPLDPTGLNRNNRVEDEPHKLNTLPNRVLCPKYGPFFSESVAVYDAGQKKMLAKGTDYVCIELLQDATNKFGKEITSLILVTNSAVTTDVSVTYQVLGGLFQNDSSSLINVYETYLKDNREIAWQNVLNKPTTFPPTLHKHLLEDVYGFEPVVVALERVRNAIVLSDVPAYEALIEWVKNNCLVGAYTNLGQSGSNFTAATYEEIDQEIATNGVITLDGLLYAMRHLNFNSVFLTPASLTMENSANNTIGIRTSNLANNTVLYWTIEHAGTVNDDFAAISGVVNIVDNTGSILLTTVKSSKYAENLEQFRIVVRRNNIAGPVMAKTALISIAAHKSEVSEYPVRYFTSPSYFIPGFERSAASFFITESIRPVPVSRRIGNRIQK